MNILFDMSILGIVNKHHGGNKTGIARVAEELAYKLLTSEECSLTFCSQEFPIHSLDSLSKELHEKYSFVKFTNHASYLADYNLDKLNSSLAKAYSQRTDSKTQLPLQKGKIFLLHHLCRWGEKTRKPVNDPVLKTRYAEQFDLYHSPHLPIPETVRSIPKLTAVLTIYDLIPILLPHTCTEFQFRSLTEQINKIRQTDWIIADSQSAKDDLCNYKKMDPSQVFVTHLAADSDKFYVCSDTATLAAVKKRYGMAADTQYFLSLCTLAPHKNLLHTVRSFVALLQSHPLPDLHLVLAGGKGWLFDDIFREIDSVDQSIRDRIILTGFVDDADLAALYSGALAFVFPSLYEGFGLPPLEAMQCGTPVITSNTSSLPEVVGDAGIMLDPTDQDGLCQAMLDVYNKPEMRSQMAAKSLAQAAKFSWERCAAETIKAYKTAVAAR